jgi:hypothetical protein
MADGRGGKRAGAGRKSRAEELGLQELLDRVFDNKSRVKVFKRLITLATDRLDGNTSVYAAKLLLGYTYGTPTRRIELTGEDGGAIEFEVVGEQLDRKLATLLARCEPKPLPAKPKPRRKG